MSGMNALQVDQLDGDRLLCPGRGTGGSADAGFERGQTPDGSDADAAAFRCSRQPAARTMRRGGRLLALAHFIRTRLGFAQDEKLRQKLLAAGLRESSAVDTYFGIRLLGPIAAVLAGTFIRSNTFMWILGLMMAAYLAPDAWVGYRTRKRRERIRLGLPDALDLMVVCVDAGTGHRSGVAAGGPGVGPQPA